MSGTVDSCRRRMIRAIAGWCALAPVSAYLPFLPVLWGCVRTKEENMKLPKVRKDGDVSVEKALAQRRTVRSFSREPLNAGQLSQVLWAGQGTTEEGGSKRAAPSAGALYPCYLYAAAGKGTVEGIEAGLYRYVPEDQSISLVSQRDIRDVLARSCLSQTWMAHAPVSIVICSDYGRITGKYGERGIRYAMIEAGHIAQNIFLEAVSLGLSAGIVGAFIDDEVIKGMGIPHTHSPLLVMPVGYRG
jgi:SagB-type dehydrogenase family enzyme